MADNSTILSDNGKLRIEVSFEKLGAKLRPVGSIDEDFNYGVIIDLVKKLGPGLKLMEFDMGHVSHLNSCGVREWVLMMERLPPTLPLKFFNVNEVIVDQANMIPNLLGKKGTPVASFHAPFHCDKCNKDVMLLMEPGHVKFEGNTPVLPEFKCQTCQSPLTFDSIEDEYFNFLAARR
jgi:hypothetical protein